MTVIVGGKEFHHHSLLLRLSSSYFDAMFSYDMRESQDMRIEFATYDPDEWELVSRFFEHHVVPETCPLVTEENVMVLLPWFQELIVNDGLLEHAKEIYGAKAEKEIITGRVIFDHLDFSDLYNLTETNAMCWEKLHDRLIGRCEMTQLTFKQIRHLKDYLRKEHGIEIWKSLIEFSYLPADFKDQDRSGLLDSPLFEHLLYARKQGKPYRPTPLPYEVGSEIE